jgi:16S rRNA G966 N2-methylase RsmD
MRPTPWIVLIGVTLGLGACGLAAGNTEVLLSQAGFRKVPADTPQRAEHLQTLAARKLIRRKSDDKVYYVYADPDYCKCMYVGSESAYATYKTLVQQQDEAMALQEERDSENFQGDK